MKIILSSLLLLSPMLAQADAPTPTEQVQAVEATRKACLAEASSTIDMRTCENEAYETADAILNAQYQAAVAKLSTATDEVSKEILHRLVVSERSWISYRDADCDFAGSAMIGGTGEYLLVDSCMADIEIARVIELDQTLNSEH